MEYRPEELYRIMDWYDEHGYIQVPGYYLKPDNHCRLCGWENPNGHTQMCPECEALYEKDKRDKQFPLGFDFLDNDDWIILQVIARQIECGEEQPHVTLEEFAEDIKARKAHEARWHAEQQAQKMRPKYRDNSLLY